MQQQNIPIGTLVDMYKRGELRLPEIQRHYVWRATRVRDLLDSLYRGYPSGSILMWETDEPIPTRDFAIAQESTAFAGRKLLLDGQQRLTSIERYFKDEIPATAADGRKLLWSQISALDHRIFHNCVFPRTEINTNDEMLLRECYDIRAFSGVRHTPDQRAIPI